MPKSVRASFWTTTPPPSRSGFSPDVPKWNVGRITLQANCCEATHSATKSSVCSWPVPQMCKGALALHLVKDVEVNKCPSCVSERLLCHGISISPWFTPSCCRDGSLAVIQPLWVQRIAKESSSCGSVHPHFASTAHALVRVAEIEEESRSIACATSPTLVGSDRSLRTTRVFARTRARCWLVLMDQRWFQRVNKLLRGPKYGNLVEVICNFNYSTAAKLLKNQQLTLWDSAA